MDFIKGNKMLTAVTVIVVIILIWLIALSAKEYIFGEDPITVQLLSSARKRDPTLSPSKPRENITTSLPYDPSYFEKREMIVSENPSLVKRLWGQ